jgi:hypothetical protein
MNGAMVATTVISQGLARGRHAASSPTNALMAATRGSECLAGMFLERLN